MASSEKCLILFAGPNGSGKSTLYNMMQEYSGIPRINIDDIAREMGSWTDDRVQIQAGKEAIKLQEKYLTEGISFNQETTLCGHRIFDIIRRAKSQEYRIKIFFVGLESAEICKQRIEARVALGGHGIPEEDVERRYIQSIENMKEALMLCDIASFYDNTCTMRLVSSFDGTNLNEYSDDIPGWYSKNFKGFSFE